MKKISLLLAFLCCVTLVRALPFPHRPDSVPPSPERIAVFLSSRDVNPAYRRATEEVGRWLGSRGATLIYGGDNQGLMEVLAQSVRQAGGRCVGVLPQVSVERGWVSLSLDERIVCADLNERKSVLFREADVFIALPGGIGTVDEIFSVLGTMSLAKERKRLVLYNVDGCWDSLIALVGDICDRGLSRQSPAEMFDVVTSVGQLEAVVRQRSRED